MPNRILRESICTSSSVDALSVEAEVLLYRLLVKADDFGRFHAHPMLVLAACFPRRIDQIQPEQVRAWLLELVAVGTVRLYESEGDLFLYFPKWQQRTRTNASKFREPPPDDGQTTANLLTDDRPDDRHDDRHDAVIPRTRYEDRGSRYEDRGSIARPRNDRHDDRQDLIFEALAEDCGIDWHHLTPSARGALNHATAALRTAGDATPDEVHRRVTAYRLTYPEAALTPSAIAKHWPALADGPRIGTTITAAERVLLRSARGEDHATGTGTAAAGEPRRGLPPA